VVFKEVFEDTKGAIRIHISKKNRQHNGQKKKYKRTLYTKSIINFVPGTAPAPLRCVKQQQERKTPSQAVEEATHDIPKTGFDAQKKKYKRTNIHIKLKIE
jgi:hypothetical protein